MIRFECQIGCVVSIQEGPPGEPPNLPRRGDMEDLRSSMPEGQILEAMRNTPTPRTEGRGVVTFSPRRDVFKVEETGGLSRQESKESTTSRDSVESPEPPEESFLLRRHRQLSASFSDMEEEVARMSKSARVVESIIHAHDLESMDEDKRHGFYDWRECPVSGSHLREGGHNAAGAAGEVFRATWKSSIPVAIKENINDNTTWNSELTREMQLFLDLHHPHVVACYGILKETIGGETYGDEMARTYTTGGSAIQLRNSIVTENCRTSLAHYLGDNSNWDGLTLDLVDRRKYTILLHVSLGLQKLHDMGVLHRDIKAGNILLDGAPGVCPTCDRQGTWKICDFGEARIMEAPMLCFKPPLHLKPGSKARLAAEKRFSTITSPLLMAAGARHYCWIRPADRLPGGPNGGDWAPCPHGGFMYSFSADPTVDDPRDCIFDISVEGEIGAQDVCAKHFPQVLGPFQLTPTELRPVINWEDNTFRLRRIKHQNPQLELLKTFGKKVVGTMSPPSEITLEPMVRRFHRRPFGLFSCCLQLARLLLSKLNSRACARLAGMSILMTCSARPSAASSYLSRRHTLCGLTKGSTWRS